MLSTHDRMVVPRRHDVSRVQIQELIDVGSLSGIGRIELVAILVGVGEEARDGAALGELEVVISEYRNLV